MRTDDSHTPVQTRREFCVQTCQALSLVAVAGALQGCGGGSSPTAPSNVPQLPVVNGTPVSGGIAVNVDASSPLASAGSAALVQASGRNFLVARTGQDTFVAVTAICTHEMCTVTGFQNQNYVCPCHGSRYNTSGVVINGPATRPLTQFPTALGDGVLTISA